MFLNQDDNLLRQALHSGFIGATAGEWSDLEPRLIQNNGFRQETVLAAIIENLRKCHSFYWAVAFITEDALAMLKLIFAELKQRGVRGKILTANYLGFNQPKVYEELLKIDNVETAILPGPFHVKGYGFKMGDYDSFILGSANLTGNALKRNFEWNVQLRGKASGKFFAHVEQSYKELYSQAVLLTKDWAERYRTIYEAHKRELPENWAAAEGLAVTEVATSLLPNKMQQSALNNLEQLRQRGEQKGLLISATGTGKTYLAAFHIRAMQPRRMLFVAHREELLQQARESFRKVLGEAGENFGLLSGNHKDYNAKYLFATVQTLAKDEVLAGFGAEDFQAVIIDEVHHGGAGSYQKLINYFKPEFCLGMTATPERRDGFNIFADFDYNIVHEIRLGEALREDLLCPFHYYGLRDFTVEDEVITEQTRFNKLTHGERVKHLLSCSDYYSHSGGKLKGLGFCSSVEEAAALAEEFTALGVEARALSGADSVAKRRAVIEELADENSSLKYILTVDIFNEGVDIPEINQIMMLRPTASPTVFIQQLGRGLRKYPGKNYVTILDFIGNYEHSCNIPLALSGDSSYNKDTLRRYLMQGAAFIPGLSTVNFAEVVKEQIFQSLDKVKWDKMQLLLAHYRSLKEKLGRIPEMADFKEHGSMDARLYFSHKASYKSAKGAPSYYGFLARYDKDFTAGLNETEERILGYVTQKFAPGKRKIDLELLRYLAEKGRAVVAAPRELIANLAKLLHNDFNTTFKVKEVFAGAELALWHRAEGKVRGDVLHGEELLKDTAWGEFTVTPQFEKALQNPLFVKFFNEILDYAEAQYREKYSALYQDTAFVYGGKYTYEEVCSLLRWEVNIPSLNIGGYKWDKATDTMPVFINYHTGSNYVRKIDYRHGFRDNSYFTCYSKPRRNLQSPEIKRMADYENNPYHIYLFLRKNKEDSQTAKEFYFLGKMIPETMRETELPNGVPGVEMNFRMEKPVEENLYNYLVRE